MTSQGDILVQYILPKNFVGLTITQAGCSEPPVPQLEPSPLQSRGMVE